MSWYEYKPESSSYDMDAKHETAMFSAVAKFILAILLAFVFIGRLFLVLLLR